MQAFPGHFPGVAIWSRQPHRSTTLGYLRLPQMVAQAQNNRAQALMVPAKLHQGFMLRRSENSCKSNLPSQFLSAKRQSPPTCVLPRLTARCAVLAQGACKQTHTAHRHAQATQAQGIIWARLFVEDTLLCRLTGPKLQSHISLGSNRMIMWHLAKQIEVAFIWAHEMRN